MKEMQEYEMFKIYFRRTIIPVVDGKGVTEKNKPVDDSCASGRCGRKGLIQKDGAVVLGIFFDNSWCHEINYEENSITLHPYFQEMKRNSQFAHYNLREDGFGIISFPIHLPEVVKIIKVKESFVLKPILQKDLVLFEITVPESEFAKANHFLMEIDTKALTNAKGTRMMPLTEAEDERNADGQNGWDKILIRHYQVLLDAYKADRFEKDFLNLGLNLVDRHWIRRRFPTHEQVNKFCSG